MTKPLFTKEEAERLAVEFANRIHNSAAIQAAVCGGFLAGIAAAKAEFQKRLEEAPVLYRKPGSGWFVRPTEMGNDTHKARLFDVEPIGEKKL